MKRRPLFVNVCPRTNNEPVVIGHSARLANADLRSESVPTEGASSEPPKVANRKKCSKQLVLGCVPSGRVAEASSKSSTMKPSAKAPSAAAASLSTSGCLPSLESEDGLSLEIMYSGALRNSGQFFMIGDGAAVAIAGWDQGKCQLRCDQYFVVSPLSFLDDDRNPVIVLECTCGGSMNQCQQLRRLDSTILLPARTIVEMREQYCVHRMISEFLGLRLRINGPDDEDSDEPAIEQHVGEPDMLWSVKSRGTYGMVRRSLQGNFGCLTCKKRRCEHVMTFQREHKNFEIELPPVTHNCDQQHIMSREKISLHDGYLSQFSYPAAGELVPLPVGTCEHGLLWADPGTEVDTDQGRCLIYNVLGQSYEGPAIKSRKSKGPCGCKQGFDGREIGLINVNNKDLVEYSLLSNYMCFFGRDGTTLSAFHDSLSQLNRDMQRDVIPYNIMYRSWMGFTELMTFDEVSGFCCRVCGVTPDIILLDGTALSCRRDLIPKEQEQPAASTRSLAGLTIRERVFIGRQKIRKLLNHFATGEVCGKKKEMSRESVEELLSLIAADYPNSSIHRLVARLAENNRTLAPDSYRLFLRELSKNTPVLGIFQRGNICDNQHLMGSLQAVIDGAIDISDAGCIEIVAVLNSVCPAIMECLFQIRRNESELQSDVRGVVSMLLDKFKEALASSERLRRETSDYCDIIEVDSSLEFFPCWPIIRGRTKYDADTERGAKDEADTCSKYSHGHKVLGPGIVVYLFKHGICYGFGVMGSYESPKMAFDVFVSRYVPSTIVYDNACKLHLYALKREPMLFTQSRFFVDKFHWYNHKACSIGYDLRRYKSDGDLVLLNSQAHEQLNASLKQLRRSLSYMKYSNFFRHLKLFLYLHNRRKNSNI